MGSNKIEPEQEFRAAERSVPIFITNVYKGTAESDITSNIYEKTSENVSLEKIVMKRLNEYDAYKFYITASKLHMFLEGNLWPQGIIYRRFVHFKKKKRDRRKCF